MSGFGGYFWPSVSECKASWIDVERSVLYGSLTCMVHLCPPACQCNGHSTCPANSSVCNQPCANFTHGPHCEHCVIGYHGNPVNGGKCIREYEAFLNDFSKIIFLMCLEC